MRNNGSKNKTALDIWSIMGNKTYLHITSHTCRVKAVAFLSRHELIWLKVHEGWYVNGTWLDLEPDKVFD